MKQETSRVLITLLIAGMSLSILLVGAALSVFAQKAGPSKDLDATVEKFLNENRRNWNDWNVPYKDPV